MLSGLIAAAILFLGARFWLAPATASAGFGIADSPAPSTGFTADQRHHRERPVSWFCLGAKLAQVTSQMIHL
jgi:hypothetical protein